MSELTGEQKHVVTKELLQHVATLQSLRSDTPGVPGESLLCPLNGLPVADGKSTVAGDRERKGGTMSFATTIWGNTT
jgi:hypothetical protein